MPDDPRDILKTAGAECAEVEEYLDDGKHNFMLHGGFGIRYIRESKADKTILALAHLVAKYKSAYEAERGHVLRGPAGMEWIRRDLAEEEIAKHKSK